jgi:SAM-dependent methyltransferase
MKETTCPCPESDLMRVLRWLGCERWAWAARRLHLPVSDGDLVLEVGSGGNPFPRSNVLCDAFEETRERHYVPLVHDRPTLLCLGEALPFKDQAFDYIVAAHVLEHTREPERFLNELQRVAPAGYIECPTAIFEKLSNYLDHRLMIHQNNDTLEITKKESWNPSDVTMLMFKDTVTSHPDWARFFRDHPFIFHVRYFWDNRLPGNRLQFEITNAHAKVDWISPEIETAAAQTSTFRRTLRKVISRIFIQSRRNQAIDLNALLRCPKCTASRLEKVGKLPENYSLRCQECGSNYEVKSSVPRLFAT